LTDDEHEGRGLMQGEKTLGADGLGGFPKETVTERSEVETRGFKSHPRRFCSSFRPKLMGPSTSKNVASDKLTVEQPPLNLRCGRTRGLFTLEVWFSLLQEGLDSFHVVLALVDFAS
jgi:hypothetical protein